MNIHNWINTLAILAIGVVVMVSGNASQYGGTTNYDSLTLDDGQLVLNGQAFCIDVFATSTDTRVSLVASTTDADTYDGNIAFQYGSCQ